MAGSLALRNAQEPHIYSPSEVLIRRSDAISNFGSPAYGASALGSWMKRKCSFAKAYEDTVCAAMHMREPE